MTQPVNQNAQQAQEQQPVFNYAGLNSSGDFLPCLKLEEGKSALVNFLAEIPYMQNPPFVHCKVHWNSEMGDNGRLFQCFGGLCCQQVTWQKGWGGEPGKFDVNKPRSRYYIPVVHYEPDPSNPAVSRATIKYIDMTWTAFDALVKTINATNEGLSFFDRDITIEVRKVNGATDYLYNKKESQAQWKTNPVFKEQVEQQLPEVAKRLMNAMPKMMTESEFLALKPTLDKKVQEAMTSHNSLMTSQSAQGFANLPSQPAQQFVQPQVNIPVQSSTLNAGTAAQSTASIQIPVIKESQVSQVPSATEPQAGQTAVTESQVQEEKPFEIPQVDLEFDPSALLK